MTQAPACCERKRAINPLGGEWRHPMQIAHHWLKEIAALRHLDPAYDCGRDCVEDIIALAS
jgi:hypothetical protein